MRSPARILFVLFTLLLTVQGEPVLGARTKVIVRPAAGRSVPEEAYGIVLLSDSMRAEHKRLLRNRLEEGILPLS